MLYVNLSGSHTGKYGDAQLASRFSLNESLKAGHRRSLLAQKVVEHCPHALKHLEAFLRVKQVIPFRPSKLENLPRLIRRVGLRSKVTLACCE